MLSAVKAYSPLRVRPGSRSRTTRFAATRSRPVAARGSRQLHGGGLGVFTSSTPLGRAEVVITNNVIVNNGVEPGAQGFGGGAWVYTYGYGTELITVRDNTIEGNRANLDGGGLSAWITTFGTRNDEDPETRRAKHGTRSLSRTTSFETTPRPETVAASICTPSPAI